MYTISDIIRNNARNLGQREALVAGAQRLSFIEFDRQVSHAAAALQSLGVAKGDRVALMGRNTLPWYWRRWARCAPARCWCRSTIS